MLKAAGVVFEAVPAHVDEEEIRLAMTADGAAPRAIADALAELKAVRVSNRAADALVLGADQILVAGGAILAKARDRDEARATLRALRGRPHELIAAACLARAGAPIWRHVETARLTMRAFDDAFLERYLDLAGEALTSNVGCYAIEGVGVQLFERMEGDRFVVEGLPLLPLLAQLRRLGAIAA